MHQYKESKMVYLIPIGMTEQYSIIGRGTCHNPMILIIIMNTFILLQELMEQVHKELLLAHEENGIIPQIITKLLLDLYHKNS